MKQQNIKLWFLWFFILPFNLSASTPLAPISPTLSISYLKDDSKSLTAQDVAKRSDFQPTAANTSLGFTSANVWMKLDVAVTQDSTKPSHLSLWPPRIENANLFKLPNSQEGEIEEIPLNKDDLKNGNAFYDAFKSNLFDLQNSNEKTTYLLRINSDFAVITKIELFDQAKLNEHRTNTGFVIGGITYGLVPFLVIFAFLSIKNKNAVYLSYLINIFGLTFFYLASIGLDVANVLRFDGPSLDHQVGFMAIISPLTTYFFLSYLCVLLGAAEDKLKWLRWCVVALILLSFSYFLLDKKWVSITFLSINIILSACTALLVYQDFQKKNLNHWLLLILFIAINLAAVNIFVSLLGFKQSSSDVFFTQSLRIALVPVVLILLITHFEEKKNQVLIALEAEKLSAEKTKSIEIDRRQTYENFVTMLLHEIKTPLSIIQIAAGSLSRYVDPKSAESNRLENIKKSVVEINQIFNKCMQVVDIENDSLHIDASEFRISLLIEDLTRSFGTDRIQFDLQCHDKVFADYVILKTILSNLISNALKYSEADSTVHLAISENVDNTNQLLFKVINKPSDIGQPEIDKTFQRFYRSEAAKKLAGSGQGLWLSQHLAMMINSKIELTTSADTTCFTLVLSSK